MCKAHFSCKFAGFFVKKYSQNCRFLKYFWHCQRKFTMTNTIFNLRIKYVWRQNSATLVGLKQTHRQKLGIAICNGICYIERRKDSCYVCDDALFWTTNFIRDDASDKNAEMSGLAIQWKTETARQSLPTLLYGGFIKWHHTAVRDNQEKNSRSIERLFFLHISDWCPMGVDTVIRQITHLIRSRQILYTSVFKRNIRMKNKKTPFCESA